MRGLIICGSRDGGFTSAMCRSFSEGLTAQGIGSDIVFPVDMNIGHCSGCDDCSAGKCIISDDMDLICEMFSKCDLLVLASPIHFSGPSSIIKTVIDRFQPLWFNPEDRRRYATSLLSGGGEKPLFRNTVSIFKALSFTAKMEWLDGIEISDTDKKKTDDVRIPAFELGSRIGSMLNTEDRV